MVTVRTLLAIAITQNWHIEQLDINNAFLHGDLHEEVYMTLPKGCYQSLPPNTVCKLTKSLYGLKQANRQWFTKLTTFLLTQGFRQSFADTSLFIITRNGLQTSLLVYVDDILITGADKAYIDFLKQQLDKTFSIKDLGALHYYLGIEFLRNPSGLAMTQRKYTLDLLKLAGVLDTKPCATPIEPITKLNLTDGTPLSDPTLYRTLVGKLIYLTITRPDISFAAQSLSQFLKEPRTTHMAALTRVLRYLKLCPGQGMFFPANNSLNLLTYCDSDWASCSFSRKSISGYGIFLGSSLISWQSKKQGVVSRSSTEAEYRALADNSCEISWLTCLLKDLQVQVPTPVPILCDNASTIALASNPIHHARTKHIEIDCHFVRNKIKAGEILPSFVPSKSQVADIFTKGLSRVLHYNCLSKLGICNPYSIPTCRGDNKDNYNMADIKKHYSIQSFYRTHPRQQHKMLQLLNSCFITCNRM
ncbi:retrovirus-related pol polyprotein from transposon TNT 1-94 [Tanacetum coccineum]